MEIDKEFRDMMKENPRYAAFRAYEKVMDRTNRRFGNQNFYNAPNGGDFLAEDFKVEAFSRYLELERGKLGFDKDGWKEWEFSFEVARGDKVLEEIGKLLVKPYPGRGKQLVAIRERKEKNIFAIEIYHPGASGMVSGSVDYLFARTTDRLACGEIFDRYERKTSSRDPN